MQDTTQNNIENQIKSERKTESIILLTTAILLSSLIILQLLSYLVLFIKSNEFYFIYPKYSKLLGWILFLFLLILLIITIIFSRFNRKKSRKTTIIAILLPINLSFLLGTIQFLFYLSNHSNYIISQDLLSNRIKYEEQSILNIINEFESKRDKCLNLLYVFNNDSIINTEKKDEKNFFESSLNSRTLFKSSFDKYTLIIKKLEKRGMIQPSLPPKLPSLGGFEKDTIYENGPSIPPKFTLLIEPINLLLTSDSLNYKYFNDFFINPNQLSFRTIRLIIKTNIDKINFKILYLQGNLKLIESRGLPLSDFIWDSIFKMIKNDLNYYTPIGFWGRFFLFIQSLLIVSPLFFLRTHIINFINKMIFKKEKGTN